MVKPLVSLVGVVLVSSLIWVTYRSDESSIVPSSPSSVDQTADAVNSPGALAESDTSVHAKAQPTSEPLAVPNSRDLSKIARVSYFVGEPEPFAEFRKQDPIADMFIYRAGRLTNEQRERYNELHIVPWNPKVADDCSVPASPSLGNGTSCHPVFERPDSHPYDAYTLEQVESLPDHDEAKAYFTAMKSAATISKEDAVDLFLESTALANKPGELLQYSYWISHGGIRTVDDHRFVYIMRKIAATMGDERSDPEAARAELRSAFGQSDEENNKFLIEVDEEISRRLAEMNRRRLELIGLPITQKQTGG
jgi:hypothetical protein